MIKPSSTSTYVLLSRSYRAADPPASPRRAPGYVASTRALLVGAGLLAGCGEPFAFTDTTSAPSDAGGGGARAATNTISAGGGGAQPASCAPASAEASLQGTWAAKARLAVGLGTIAGGAIGVCPVDQVDTASLLMLVTIVPDASDATKLSEVRATLCGIEMPTISTSVGLCDPGSQGLVRTRFLPTPNLVAALPEVATALGSGSIGGLATGASFAAGPFPFTVGSSKHGAEMPAWKTGNIACGQPGLGHTSACVEECVTDCGSLRDHDEDGFPGVTVDVCGATVDQEKANVACHAATPSQPGVALQGKAFIDLSVSPALHGTVKSACEVTGTVGAEWIYNVVGADVYLAGASLPVSVTQWSLPSFHVDQDASELRMVRVDGRFGGPDWQVDPKDAAEACATIRMRANEL